MAETKGTKAKAKSKPKGSSKTSKAKSSASKSSAKPSPSKSSASKRSSSKSSSPKASRPKANAAKAGSAANGKASPSSSNGDGPGHAVKETAQKVALPLLATGAAVAGAAAVIVGKNGHKQRKVLGVKVPKKPKAHLPHVGMPKVSMPKGKGLKGDVRRAAGAVTDAAEKADQIGKRISRVASSVQAVGEATDDAAKKS